MIFDYTAKKYIQLYKNNSISVKQEIAEERRVVYQAVLSKTRSHFKYLIIGSSRVMPFGQLTGFQNTLNLGVSGAGLHDIEFIFNLTKKMQITYDTIIFDFNPWLVIHESDPRHKQFYVYHQVKLAIYDILTFNYNHEDLMTFWGTTNKYKFAYHASTPKEIENRNFFIKNPDGSIQNKRISKLEKRKSIDETAQNLYQMGKFYSIDFNLLRRVNSLYKKASRHGKCIVTLTPFHKDIFLKNISDIRMLNVNKVEAELKKYKTNYLILGSFNPDVVNLSDKDFYDGLHINEEAIKKIFSPQVFTK